MNYLAIAIGGACGALLRYGIGVWTRQWLAGSAFSLPEFPTGTLIANLLGAFLMGLLYQVFERTAASGPLPLLLTTGFLGALTTFSTFALEAVLLFRMGNGGTAIVYLFVSNLLGVSCILAGIMIGGRLT